MAPMGQGDSKKKPSESETSAETTEQTQNLPEEVKEICEKMITDTLETLDKTVDKKREKCLDTLQREEVKCPVSEIRSQDSAILEAKIQEVQKNEPAAACDAPKSQTREKVEVEETKISAPINSNDDHQATGVKLDEVIGEMESMGLSRTAVSNNAVISATTETAKPDIVQEQDETPKQVIDWNSEVVFEEEPKTSMTDENHSQVKKCEAKLSDSETKSDKIVDSETPVKVGGINMDDSHASKSADEIKSVSASSDEHFSSSEEKNE